jgi:hypothetical protein
LVGDQAGRAVAFDLLELIAIHRDIAPRPQIARPARQRPEHGQDGHGRHQSKPEPQRHALKSIRSKSMFRRRRGRRTTCSLIGDAQRGLHHDDARPATGNDPCGRDIAKRELVNLP